MSFNMKPNPWTLTACALALAAVFLFDASAVMAAGPLDSVARKGEDARMQIVMLGKVAIGIVAAVLFCLAAFGQVAWKWVIMVVVAGAGLTGIDAVTSWINS
jgi:hypothetical protein